MTAAKKQHIDDEHLFADMIRLNAEVLLAAGLNDDLVQRLAEDLCSRFGEEYGGASIYVPVGRFWQQNERYQQIFAEYNGHNARELAKKYGNTERWIQRIVSKVRAENFIDRQGKLLPD